MTEKELLYVDDAVNHELFMIQTCYEICDCLTDANLTKLLKKIMKKHENILNMLMEIL